MRRFAAMFDRLDATTSTNAKVAVLVDYFRGAPPADAAWAIALLSGRKVGRAVPGSLLRDLVHEATDLPPWLVAECHAAVGDLSETIALLVPDQTDDGTDLSLSEFIDRHVLPLSMVDRQGQRRRIGETWAMLNRTQRFLFHKLISTSFRVGVSKKLVIRAVGEAFDIDPAVVAHRLTGRWEPSAEALGKLIDPDTSTNEPGRPYPFCLAHPYEGALGELGPVGDWQIEWKWDGIRAQLIRRAGRTMLWSRGDEAIGAAFPEIVQVAGGLPDGTVIDGELLAWADGEPLPFSELQKRLNRKRVQRSFWPEVPVAMMAYDLLERGGEDVRDRTTAERRAMLEELLAERGGEEALRLSPVLDPPDWGAAEALRRQSRQRGVEGLMLKRKSSTYGVGRRRGDWWKLKVEPFTIDAVMVAAQPGSGKRASLFTDYTFAVRDGGRLVTIAKAYSGLTDAEIRRVDRWVRRHTTAKHGPVRSVEPTQVFELAFEGVAESDRHKAGLALRFPRIARRRDDKPAEEIDTLDNVRELLRAVRR